jgi:hypothetical protein
MFCHNSEFHPIRGLPTAPAPRPVPRLRIIGPFRITFPTLFGALVNSRLSFVCGFPFATFIDNQPTLNEHFLEPLLT